MPSGNHISLSRTEFSVRSAKAATVGSGRAGSGAEVGVGGSHATAGHDGEACAGGDADGLGRFGAGLKPQDAGAGGDHLMGDRGRFGGWAEHVDNIDRIGDVGEGRADGLTEQFTSAGLTGRIR
jgi:hypothetical protein